jgi:hypothetical protein
VQPGGAEALQCLQRNVAKLSRGCQSAVNALSPAAAPQQAASPPAAAPAMPSSVTAAAPPAAQPAGMSALTPEQQTAMRQFCGADYMAKCGNVAPSAPAARQCLLSHEAELSANCRGALTLLGVGGSPTAVQSPPPAQAATATSAPAATQPAAPHPSASRRATHATAAVAAPPARPTAQQQAAIRQSCQSDFMAKCSGVKPGGADALHCLQRNSAQLSSNCRSAVAAIGGGASHATAAAAAPAAAAPAAMPTAEQQSAIKRACQRDFMMNCRGVQPGGQEALACLQRNASRLSANCRTSLAAVASGEPVPAAAAEAAPAARPVPAGPFPLRRAIRRRMMEQQ